MSLPGLRSFLLKHTENSTQLNPWDGSCADSWIFCTLCTPLPSPFLCSTNASDLSPSELVRLSPQLMETVRFVYFHLPLQLPKSCLAALSWAAVWPFSEDAFLEASEPSTACCSVSESYYICCFLSVHIGRMVHLVANQFWRSNSLLRKTRREVNFQTLLISSRLPSWILSP